MKIAVRKRRAPSIIIVSLVDILTILLIFFVVSTTFKKDQPEVQINLPESATATVQPTAQTEHAIVSVSEADEVRLDGNPLPVEELEAAVRNLPAARKTTLALEADKKASFGTIIKVMDALKLAGVKNLPAFTNPGK